MKRSYRSLVIRQVQIKTTKTEQYTATRMAFKNLTLQSPNMEAEQLEYSSVAAGNVKQYSHFAKQIGSF